MLIVSFKNYIVEIDRLNHTLIEEVASKDGKVYRKYLGYFSNMESVAKHLILNEQEKSNDTIELKQFLEHYKDLSEKVLDEIKSADIEYKDKWENIKKRKKEGK